MDQETITLIEEFDRNTADQGVRDRVLARVRETSDPSEIIGRIMSGCTSRLLDDRRSAGSLSQKFTFSVGGIAESPIQYLEGPPDPTGKVHSEHLYFAARCIGVAQRVDPLIVEDVAGRLLSEFDLEIDYPGAAIAAFADIGEAAIPILISYVQDSTKETFSREDAAQALGRIGTDQAVDAIGEWLKTAPDNDKAMPLYALGKTRNAKAKTLVTRFLKEFPDHPSAWVARDALAAI